MSNRHLPHKAVITFDIKIMPINLDETLGVPISDKRLMKYHMGSQAQIAVSGVSEADCVQNVKNKLEKLNEQMGE